MDEQKVSCSRSRSLMFKFIYYSSYAFLSYGRLKETHDDAYLDRQYSLLDIALTLTGYHRLDERLFCPGTLVKRWQFGILPARTRDFLQQLFNDGVLSFDTEVSHLCTDEDLPMSELLPRPANMVEQVKIKATIEYKKESYDFSESCAKKLGVHVSAWFIGPRTKNHSFYLYQPHLLQDLKFDREVALALAIVYDKSWPGWKREKNENVEALTYPIDKDVYKKSKLVAKDLKRADNGLEINQLVYVINFGEIYVGSAGGRKLLGHPTGVGTVIESNDGQDRNVLVSDAQYRARDVLMTSSYTATSLPNYTFRNVNVTWNIDGGSSITTLNACASLADANPNSLRKNSTDTNTSQYNTDVWLAQPDCDCATQGRCIKKECQEEKPKVQKFETKSSPSKRRLARYISEAEEACNERPLANPYLTMRQFIRVGLSRWKSDLKNEDCDLESINPNHRIAQGLLDASLEDYSGKHNPVMADKKKWEMPIKMSPQQMLEDVFYEIFPQEKSESQR